MMRRFAMVLALVLGLLLPTVDAAASGVVVSQGAVAGTEQVLFRAGTAGYGCFRIPALVRTAQGSLLAFAEARRSPSCADRGDIDTVVRRSTNNGRTWGPIRVVLSGSADDPFAPFTRGNPAPVVDRTTGAVFLVSTSNDASAGGPRLPWVQRSDDDGLTWTTAQRLTASFDGTTDGWFATGPGHGVQLSSGRLVVGAHQKPRSGVVNAGVLYSDDHGLTWHASAAANSFVDGQLSPGEVSVAELPDGGLYASARNEITDGDHRAMAVSTDGGTTMPAFTTVPSLVTPSVQGSVLAPQQTYQSRPGDTLLFSGPADPSDRKLMTVRYSTNNGVSWTTPAHGLITNQRSGYSDLAELTDGEIGLLYEGGVSFSADEIRFNRFTPAELGIPGTFTGKPSTQPIPLAGPTTPDASPEANDAYLAGNATVNQGLVLDGSGDYADVPYSRSLDPGSGDFTYTTSFSYSASASSPNQVLFWAYGVGSGAPQVWLRAQPGQDQVLAWVQGDTGATVAVKDSSSAYAFGDGANHSLTLTRSGSQIRLTVDGASATASGVSGSVSAGTLGLRLGAKPDGSAGDPFHGTLRDFRFSRSAGGTAAPVLRLPFAMVDGAATVSRTTVAISDDVSAHCADGSLLGGLGTRVDGRVAGTLALQIDSSHPGVETPFVPSLDLGDGDFTLTTWFRYDATASSPNQALLWAFGASSGKRSVWVRAQPAQDRLYAWVQTDTGQVAVALPDTSGATAFGDGAWHPLALSRSAGQVRLSVGTQSATATGLTGSVTAGKADILGLRAGSKPDGTDVFTGVFDEVRVYPRALTDAEAAGAYPSDRPSLWWSFENQTTQQHDVARLADGPSTPDYAGHCAGAYVRGGAALGPGKTGSALAFDGTSDDVELPYSPSTALGAGDFTFTTWLKYSATPADADQVVLWAYGTGSTARSLWLRAQPSKDRLYAWIQTDTGAAGVAAPDTAASVAFGDGAWHHLALRRAGTTLSLIVDGTTVGSATVAGSLSYDDTFTADGLELGAKPDGTNRLRGSLDEFRLFRKALSGSELDAVRQDNADLGMVTAVRLPFDTLSATAHARM
ncbi:exo-alpha-sialidase [Amycolatopsis cynarae]|uniref:exo-alpha-sialidase n=1 Tax=Amycolatopsis cynarae TaxID=2995223 RepID=A0ABY7AY10_9PSEU|nr:LamG-like jellyroll fold domain-containing protein [Amycolatopsis sp. HUAS 11-8]WAL63541.1 exo-alpha-sialidase [Amycolatopsis sp. HUAS 11-8]